LTLALDGGEWSISFPCHFSTGERAPRAHWIGGWVGTKVFAHPPQFFLRYLTKNYNELNENEFINTLLQTKPINQSINK
jgi:hypothetical protein